MFTILLPLNDLRLIQASRSKINFYDSWILRVQEFTYHFGIKADWSLCVYESFVSNSDHRTTEGLNEALESYMKQMTENQQWLGQQEVHMTSKIIKKSHEQCSAGDLLKALTKKFGIGEEEEEARSTEEFLKEPYEIEGKKCKSFQNRN